MMEVCSNCTKLFNRSLIKSLFLYHSCVCTPRFRIVSSSRRSNKHTQSVNVKNNLNFFTVLQMNNLHRTNRAERL